MITANQQAQGLTKVILQTLKDMTPELEAEGRTWSQEMLRRVEEDVRRQVGMRDSQRNQLIFDMVLKRSFAEAWALFTQSAPSAETERSIYPFPSLPTRQAVA